MYEGFSKFLKTNMNLEAIIGEVFNPKENWVSITPSIVIVIVCRTN